LIKRDTLLGEQNRLQQTTWTKPENDDRQEWMLYWRRTRQSWRREPEIDDERKKFLAKRRKIKPDEKQGIYPFKDIKLSRADVEWLLATHGNGRGPVDWNDESQREREGLDLRGADLRELDLYELPLARIIAGPRQINVDETDELEEAAITHLEGANLVLAHLEGAVLHKAHLEKAGLLEAHLEKASLISAHLEKACLDSAHLERAACQVAHFEGTSLYCAHLEGAYLYNAHLEGANLQSAYLEGAHLDRAFFDSATSLEGASLSDSKYGSASLVDIHWGDVNLAVIDWSTISILGDESDHLYVDIETYKIATRAYRQLSVALRNQGLNEDAARFAFRAQRMQRKLFWYQHKFGQYLFSGFLNLLSGYGYRFWRSFVAYAFVIGVFAAIYYHIGPHLAWYESIVISMTAFHGRGFFPTQFNPGDPQAIAAAIEALFGLFIEITLIATLTQRLFGK
jgi:uncharacterized protein YjbI with pentapeptide repeats